MGGAIHPLPQYAFMAWCLVKAQGQLYLTFLGCIASNNDVEDHHKWWVVKYKWVCIICVHELSRNLPINLQGIVVLRIVGILLQHYTASQPRRQRLEYPPLWKPHISHFNIISVFVIWYIVFEIMTIIPRRRLPFSQLILTLALMEG
jgi:hypothetical protein